MPRTYEWSAPVWQADVDAFGELRSSVVLRFLQETATRASADAGFDPAYYVHVDGMWIVRRTTVEFDAPVRYGATLVGRTWVADFRRVRSERRYEILVDGRVVTRAGTDWVYVNRTHGKPRRVPLEIERAFAPESSLPLARRTFPTHAPSAAAFAMHRRVEAHELDALRHVNNANYVHYVAQSVLDACTSLDWPLERQLNAGGHLRAVAYDLEYLDAALYQDVLLVRTWPKAVSDTTLEWHTWVNRSHTPDRPLLHATSRWRWAALESGAHDRLPDDLQRSCAGAWNASSCSTAAR